MIINLFCFSLQWIVEFYSINLYHSRFYVHYLKELITNWVKDKFIDENQLNLFQYTFYRIEFENCKLCIDIEPKMQNTQ